MANPLYQKHIISINDLSREELELVLNTAARLKANPQPELLKHKVIASCFFEASTRTRLSFETSIHRLGRAWSASRTVATHRSARRAKPWRTPSPSSAPMWMRLSCATRRRGPARWHRTEYRHAFHVLSG